MAYYIGFWDRIASKKTFVILAETRCPIVAGYIERNYNRDYAKVGNGLVAVIHTKKTLPKNHKWSD